jgi:hypothetical protein
MDLMDQLCVDSLRCNPGHFFGPSGHRNKAGKNIGCNPGSQSGNSGHIEAGCLLWSSVVSSFTFRNVVTLHLSEFTLLLINTSHGGCTELSANAAGVGVRTYGFILSADAAR